jgi:hypothetical protein
LEMRNPEAIAQPPPFANQWRLPNLHPRWYNNQSHIEEIL